ncbi:MAG TPA: type IV pilus assembly protein PilM [bacterium]
MGLFGSRSFIGLDIGSQAIKIVELEPNGGSFRVLHAGSGVTPPGAVREGGVTEPHILSDAIRRVVSSAGVRRGRVVSAVGGQAVIVRELKMPKMAKPDLQQAVRFEAGRYLPYSVRDVSMDFDVLGELVEDGQPKVEVLLVAARQEVVDKHLDAVRGAGLQPFVLDVESFATMRALEAQSHADGGPPAAVFVGLGAETTDILVTERDRLRLTRNVNIGGNNLTRAVASRLDVEFSMAEELKKEKGRVLLEGEPLPDDQAVLSIHEAMLPILTDLATELRRSLDYFQTRWRESRIGRVILSGGTARLGNLDRFLSLELGIETVVGDPFAVCSLPESVMNAENRRQVGPSMAAAVGLAMRGAAET